MLVSVNTYKRNILLVLKENYRKFVSFAFKKASNHAGLRGSYNSVYNYICTTTNKGFRHRKFVSFTFFPAAGKYIRKKNNEKKLGSGYFLLYLLKLTTVYSF